MLSFAGTPLLLDTEVHSDWVRQWHDYAATVLTDNAGWAGSTLDELPLPPRPAEPPIEIGVLTWPTGASRCATFFGLVDDRRLETIRQTITDSDSEYQYLVLSDGNTGHTVTVEMRMLPPLPVHQIDGRAQLYVLPLVDYRFDWRWTSGDVTDRPVSWTDLFATLSDQIGAGLTGGSVAGEYGTPSRRWVQYRQPLTQLLDAACRTVHEKVVVGLDGTAERVTWADALDAAAEQWETVRHLIGGTIPRADLTRLVPASVTVAFGRTVNGVGRPDPHTVEVALADLEIEEYGDSEGIDGATATVYADLIADGDNDTECDDYAAQAAADWYGWQLCDLDTTLPGIVNWAPTGTEDRIEWTYQHGGRLLTRIVRGYWQEQPVRFLTGDSRGVADVTVCPVFSSGVVVGVTTKVTHSDGTVVCKDNSTDCCTSAPTVTVPCCPDPMPTTLCLDVTYSDVFGEKTEEHLTLNWIGSGALAIWKTLPQAYCSDPLDRTYSWDLYCQNTGGTSDTWVLRLSDGHGVECGQVSVSANVASCSPFSTPTEVTITRSPRPTKCDDEAQPLPITATVTVSQTGCGGSQRYNCVGGTCVGAADGTYGSLADCLAVCGGGTACCETEPESVDMAVTAHDSCTHSDPPPFSDTLARTGEGSWSGSGFTGCAVCSCSLTCSGGVWVPNFGSCNTYFQNVVLVLAQCDPFLVVFDATYNCGAFCNTPVTITFTESE